MRPRLPSLAIALAALAPGCGMLLDLDPPSDGGAGMDASAGRRDAGSGPECLTAADCDDGVFCNGLEVCAAGSCAPGMPVTCDDGVDCTLDTCDEATDQCLSRPDDSRCEGARGCVTEICDAHQGCQPSLDDAMCDDGVDCTLDTCDASGDCAHLPLDGSCPSGEVCSVEDGCGPPPACTHTADCPPRLCKIAVTCDAGVCRYDPASEDSACTSPDPCRPAMCRGGECRIGDPIPCVDTPDPGGCVRGTCDRRPDGSVECVVSNRNGERCTTTEPCTTGVCNGDVCETTSTCVSADPCVVAACIGGGCALAPVDCGPNATCVADASGGYTCECDPGAYDCMPGVPGCECVTPEDGGRGTCAGPMGWLDCDGDGRCDCDGTHGWICVGGRCLAYMRASS